ncbi:MAG: PD-(D/E)XK nuclease family protein, partial [Bacteroidota bacterium]
AHLPLWKPEQLALRIIELGERQGWMGNALKAMNEMELLSFAGADAEIIRPDRVVFGDSNTLVVDYKTGSQLPKHHKQVQQYIRALQQLNYPNVSGKLVYIDSQTVIEVGDL